MMPADYIRQAIASLPPGSSVIISVEGLETWLEDTPDPGGLDPDMTIEEVAAFFRKSEFTVRRWLRDEELRGYKVGGEWRATKAACRERQAELRRAGEKNV